MKKFDKMQKNTQNTRGKTASFKKFSVGGGKNDKKNGTKR